MADTPIGLTNKQRHQVCELLDEIGALRAELAAERTRRETVEQEREAARDDGPPGQYICRTCGFVLMKMTLRATDMAVGLDARPVYDICPNDGSSMRRLTWQEDALNSDRVGRQQLQRAGEFADMLRKVREACEWSLAACADVGGSEPSFDNEQLRGEAHLATRLLAILQPLELIDGKSELRASAELFS